MRIIFTQHSLSQMKIRNISMENVIECLRNPDRELTDDYNNIIAQKINSSILLRVVYRKENEDKIVITAYITSKLKKYI